MFQGPEGSVHEQSIIEALSMVSHPSAKERLASMARDGTRPADVRARAERLKTRLERR
jgi:hypothetical protein